jgi:hypothetical protein
MTVQEQLIELIKQRIQGQETVGRVLADILSISQDAAYRRNRGETPFTIDEVKKLCLHFNISFDSLCNIDQTKVLFEYNPLINYDFSLESYLEGLLHAFRRLSNTTQPKIVLTANNIALFQLLNFPHLIRFRLYFWAKTHLQIPEYQDQLFEHEKVTENAYNLGREILQRYNKIPTAECYDPEFLKGLLRHIHYYASAHLFKDPYYALRLVDEVKMMSSHIKHQATLGKKFIYGEQPPADGHQYDVYLNDTINTDNTFYYTSEEAEGIYLAHNHMNYLHTSDKNYTRESKLIIDKQIANSSLISRVNEKQRNAFFHKIDMNIQLFRQKIEADILL